MAWLFTGLLVASAMSFANDAISKRSEGQQLDVNGRAAGGIFDGIGALSAGASSRLLVDYPQKQRGQILDYLFKPNYGAALQILKVEIGGDTNSTDGTEPSHMHTSADLDCYRGYEWWLMEQARKRNPQIKNSVLEWGAPAWVGMGTQTVWTSNNLTYIDKWLGCAKKNHVEVSYIGGWNERDFDVGWYKMLKKNLDEHGYGDIKVVAADSFSWEAVTKAMQKDPGFKSTVDIVGVHYPCGHLSKSTHCPSTLDAQASGKILWDSEGGSQPYDTGALALAREINHDYVDGRMTAMINWSLIWSAYEGLPFQGSGLMEANTPWSGHYVIGPSIWVVAHTTQFAHPGWHYINSGSARLQRGGSVVSLRSPDGHDWSSVAETTDATQNQKIVFRISGGLDAKDIHVWASNLKSDNPSHWFVQKADLKAVNGRVSATLQPGYMYSFTTTTGQRKGSAIPPESAPWKLPYFDNFNKDTVGTQPRFFSDIGGVFEIQPCIGTTPDGGAKPSRGAGHDRPQESGRESNNTSALGPASGDRCLQQVVAAEPVLWNDADDFPITLVGSPTSWKNYKVGVDVRLPAGGWVDLAGRVVGMPGYGPSKGQKSGLTGYHLHVSTQGGWRIYKQDAKGIDTTLTQGVLSFDKRQWHRIELTMDGEKITPYIDGKALKSVTDSSYRMGQVSIAFNAWNKGQLDNFSVTPEK